MTKRGSAVGRVHPGARMLGSYNTAMKELTRQMREALRGSDVQEAFTVNQFAGTLSERAVALCRRYDLPDGCKEFGDRLAKFREVRALFKTCKCKR